MRKIRYEAKVFEKRIILSKNLIQLNRYTPQIERNNGRQRHWLTAFKRQSIVVTKSLENLRKP